MAGMGTISGGGLSKAGAGGENKSIVAACNVTNCVYNRSAECTAGAINVSFVNGMAHCATYSAREDDDYTSDDAGRIGTTVSGDDVVGGQGGRAPDAMAS